jgi:glycerate kinase
MITAPWLAREDGSEAFVEMAAASGLSRLASDEHDPIGATTLGTGELLRAVIDEGIHEIALGIGGSATTDGGSGLLRALGATVGDGQDAVDLAGLDPRLAKVRLRVACDVSNPLLGRHGAAAVYGPQKGATPEVVSWLDARNARWADALDSATGRDERQTPGAGAAGGLGFALLSIAERFADLRLQPGVDLVMAEARFDEVLAAADLVITGEGRIDAQTAFGKTAMGVARRAHAAGKRCIAIGGGATPEGIEVLGALGVEVVAAHDRPITLEAARAAGTEPVARAAERLAARMA